MLRRFVSIRMPHLPADLAKRRRRMRMKQETAARIDPRNAGSRARTAPTPADLRDGPAGFVLVVDLRHNAQRVIDCCSNSVEMGIRSMMTLTEARAILASNPSNASPPESLVLSPATPRRDLADLRRLAAACLRFAPITAVDGSDGILLDLSGCHRILARRGGESGLLDRIERCFGRHGFTVSLAAADTAPAARAWAGYRDAWRPDRGGHATPGVRIAGPATRDPRIISPDATSARLDGLPIESLDLDPDTLEALRAVNVRLVGELRRLPRIALPARYGAAVLHRIDQAMGRAPTILDPVRPSSAVSVRREFDGPVRSRSVIELAIADLLNPLRRRLAGLEAGARVVRLRAERPMDRDWLDGVELRRPTRRRRRLWTMLQPLIERLPLDDGVDALELEVPRHRRMPHEGSPLIHDSTRRGVASPGVRIDVETTEFIEGVQARFGAVAIQRMRTPSGHIPEDEAGFASVDDPAEHPTGPGAVFGGEPRPTVVHRPPVPIEVGCRASLPTTVIHGGMRHVVASEWGPERIGAPWWRAPSDGNGDDEELRREHRRDYWRLELECGTWIWVFQASSDRRWFLHGTWA
ncbi:MAG: hypothetical protein CMJ52_00855 [Planctomycetaceae bacterium]|nr:hypothetical protein [Planctomycetaceae bacterium]